MALNKIYDTAFERLCLEDRPEFSDPELQKILQIIYNRSGYLKVGDKFFCYDDNNNGIVRLMLGKVVGANKYIIERILYRINHYSLSFACSDKDAEKVLEVNERQLTSAKLLGSTLFKKEIFIPFDVNIYGDIREKEIYKYHGSPFFVDIDAQYIEDADTELRIVGYIYTRDGLFNELQNEYEIYNYAVVVVDDVVDDIKYLHNYDIKEQDILLMKKIPKTNKHLVVYSLDEE